MISEVRGADDGGGGCGANDAGRGDEGGGGFFPCISGRPSKLVCTWSNEIVLAPLMISCAPSGPFIFVICVFVMPPFASSKHSLLKLTSSWLAPKFEGTA
jgi:hypothetical protein